MKEKIIQIDNCLASKRIHSHASDESPEGDNNYHCPITGYWVELTKKSDNFICKFSEGLLCPHEIWEDA